jgi:hypothetical protein
MTDPLADARNNRQLDAPQQSRYGFTMRELACLELRVPESGTEWLDSLIVTSRRMDAGENVLDLYSLREEENSVGDDAHTVDT